MSGAVTDPQAGNAVSIERRLSSGEFVSSECVPLARIFSTDDPGARSDDHGSLTTKRAALLSGALSDCGVTPVAALSLRLGILSAFDLRSFEAMDNRTRPSAPPVSNWADQQDNTTCDRHPAGYDPKGPLLDMAERNVPGISKGEVRGGGRKPQEYPEKAEDRS